MCTHRGNRLARADDGNSKRFMCTYHGWTFENDGCLTHIPGEQEAYYGEVDKSRLGMVEARVDTYAGIIFACWDKDAPSLEDWLGDARWYMDTIFNRSDAGMVAMGPQKWMEQCNWKTPVDNCSDNYHLAFSHYAAAFARHKVSGEPMRGLDYLLQDPNPNHHAFVNGHSLTFRVADGSPDIVQRLRGQNLSRLQSILEQFDRDKAPEVERRLGAYRANKLRMGNHSVFPNHVLGFRLALPRGPLQTEFWHFALVEADAPEEMKLARSIGSGNQNGAGGVVEQDDMDNWAQVTQASLSPKARHFAADLSMGVGHAGHNEEWPGRVSQRYISENNQRGYYERWQEFMNANSWKDIHVDPITVTFEGTATMRG
jgi:phenylpropionate dioxygenase-like ring-hydroxylating dioxygenase large terminal subunit